MARSFSTMRSSAPLPTLRRSLGAVVAAWSMVCAILFCALLPAGLPQSVADGSAFNPATTSVALRSSGPKRFLAKQSLARKAKDPLPDRQVAFVPACSPGACALTSNAPHAPLMRGTIAPAILHHLALSGLRGAREPPAA